jgi:TonB family protein
MSMLQVLAAAAAAIVPGEPASPPPPGAVPAKARANLAVLLSDDDYPAEAIRKGEQGTVGFRLAVSPEGLVTDCSVIASSGSAILDGQTCRLMSERARFTPARDVRGGAAADTVQARIRWILPEPPAGTIQLGPSLRSITNVWEVTADGRERNCRRAYRFEGGERIDVPECLALDRAFVAAAAAFLQARPEEVLTARLENRWTIDAVLPFAAVPADRGQLLVRGEGDYRLNDDLSVRDCMEGSFSARFSWKPAPCFRKSFADHVPAGTGRVRMEVQWVVSRGPDIDRPAKLPQFTGPDGKPVTITIRQSSPKQEGASPR